MLGFYDEWIWEEGHDGGIKRDALSLLFNDEEAYCEIINNDKRGFELVFIVENVDDV